MGLQVMLFDLCPSLKFAIATEDAKAGPPAFGDLDWQGLIAGVQGEGAREGCRG